MSNSGFSETKDADEIMAPCDPNIIPIFPARYAISDAALLNMVKHGTAPTAPSTLTGSGDHDLRRIRQGYVYIYSVRSQNPWQVFRYHTGSDDDNSPGTESDTQEHYNSYKFAKYMWTTDPETGRGGAAGYWQIEENRIYPYAFVGENVSEIYIAYSEERWPAYFFERAEVDIGFRQKIMQYVNLVSEETDYSCPLQNIADHVAEFKEDTPEYPPSNAYRYVALKPENTTQVVDCEHSGTVGRVIALHDHMGELLDIQSAILVKSHSARTYAASYEYPLKIGKCIRSVRDTITDRWEEGFDAWWRELWGNHPLGVQYDTKFRQIEAGGLLLEANVKALVEAYYDVLDRSGNFTVGMQRDLVNAGKELDSRPHFVAKLLDYGFHLLARIYESIGTCEVGSAKILGTLLDVQGLQNSTWAEFIHGIISKISDVKHEFNLKYGQNINLFFAATANEFAQAFYYRPDGGAFLTKFRGSLGLQFDLIDVSLNQLDDQFRSQLADLGLSTQYNSRTGVMQGNARAQQTSIGDHTIKMLDIEVQADGFMNAQGHRTLNESRIRQGVFNGLGLILGFWSGIEALRDWNQPQDNETLIGDAVTDPRVQIGAALMDVLSGSYALAAVRNQSAYAGHMTQEIFENLFTGGAKTSSFIDDTVMAAKGFIGRGGVAATMKTAAMLGKFAGILGVVVNGGLAIEGFLRGDRAMMTGNALMAIGGLVMVAGTATGIGAIPGLIIGGLITAIGFAITLAQDSAFDRWVRECFWGNSDDYWGKTRYQLIDLQIDEAKALARGDADMSANYQKELAAFQAVM